MNIIISAHQFQLPEPVRLYGIKKISKLGLLSPKLTQAYLDLSLEKFPHSIRSRLMAIPHPLHRADLRFHVDGIHYHLTAVAYDPYRAINQIKSKGLQKMRKEKMRHAPQLSRTNRQALINLQRNRTASRPCSLSS